jgi:hypothetical protein
MQDIRFILKFLLCFKIAKFLNLNRILFDFPINCDMITRDKEMAHSIQSTAIDVFSLPPAWKTNSTVVPLSASSRSLVLSGGCVCVGGQGGQRGGET